jgi:uncharacterized LabA/DUF88 family protein
MPVPYAIFNAYVDGESHYIRTEKHWQKLHGPGAALETLEGVSSISLHRRGGFFWDHGFVDMYFTGMPFHRAVYFTSAAGDDNEVHALRLFIRDHGLEPYVVKEPKSLEKQRENALRQGIIEKPKGVDIALTVQMIEDAQRDHFDGCVLFTSDVDYLPLIEAVRRLGKRVIVAGYREGLGENSPFEFVPDQFIDLGDDLKTRCRLKA